MVEANFSVQLKSSSTIEHSPSIMYDKLCVAISLQLHLSLSVECGKAGLQETALIGLFIQYLCDKSIDLFIFVPEK